MKQRQCETWRKKYGFNLSVSHRRSGRFRRLYAGAAHTRTHMLNIHTHTHTHADTCTHTHKHKVHTHSSTRYTHARTCAHTHKQTHTPVHTTGQEF